MKFNEKLKNAMQQLGISQAQLVGMTGIGKSSISQYLSGKNVPAVDRQKSIAVSLGLEADYFEQDNFTIKQLKSGVIPQIRPGDAAKLMRKNSQNIRKGLQQGVFDWGYAIRTSKPDAVKPTYTYFINARRFVEIEGIEVPPEMVV